MSTASDPSLAAVQRGQVLCDLRRYSEAVQVLGEAVAADAQNPVAWCLMARARIGEKRYELAFEAASKAAALAPALDWPHRLMSIAAVGRANPVAARRHAETAVRLAPHEWRAHLQLGNALLSGDDTDGAEAAAQRAVALAPHEAETHFLTGRVAAAARRRREASAAFQRALAIDPDNSAVLNELARLRLRRKLIGNVNPGRLATAAAGFAAAVRADPNSEVSRRNLELVLRSFLRLLAYYIFLVAWIGGLVLNPRVTPAHGPVMLALVALPVSYAIWFVVRLPSVLRRHLARAALSGWRWIGTSLEAGAVLALVASALASRRTGDGLAMLALGLAVVARLVLRAQRA